MPGPKYPARNTWPEIPGPKYPARNTRPEVGEANLCFAYTPACERARAPLPVRVLSLFFHFFTLVTVERALPKAASCDALKNLEFRNTGSFHLIFSPSLWAFYGSRKQLFSEEYLILFNAELRIFLLFPCSLYQQMYFDIKIQYV